jgi:hypothetical protein
VDKVECPRCESPQKFPRLPRDSEEIEGIKEVYIRCPVCRFESVIGHTTDEIERLSRQIAKASARKQDEINRHGVPSRLVQDILTRLTQQMGEKSSELAKRIKEEING